MQAAFVLSLNEILTRWKEPELGALASYLEWLPTLQDQHVLNNWTVKLVHLDHGGGMVVELH